MERFLNDARIALGKKRTQYHSHNEAKTHPEDGQTKAKTHPPAIIQNPFGIFLVLVLVRDHLNHQKNIHNEASVYPGFSLTS